jgi:hypothetical protein
MDRTQKIDCGTNGEVIFTGATIKFQLKEGLTLSFSRIAFKQERIVGSSAGE